MGQKRTTRAQTDPILSLGQALEKFDYQKPTPEDIEAIRADAEDLLTWLKEHQAEENDFIRACLIEGVQKFIFRLDKFRWVGWAYAIESLREIVGAYLALESGCDPESMPQTKAILQKVSAKLLRAMEIVSKGREVKDDAEFLIAAFRAGTPVVTGVAGYLAA